MPILYNLHQNIHCMLTVILAYVPKQTLPNIFKRYAFLASLSLNTYLGR